MINQFDEEEKIDIIWSYEYISNKKRGNGEDGRTAIADLQILCISERCSEGQLVCR